eukprot:c21747_g1_i1 orf=74-1543(+)
MASTNKASNAAALPASSTVEQLLAGANDTKLSTAPLKLVALPSPHDVSLPLQGFYRTSHMQKQNVPLVEVPKMVTEYPMPGARQTHEMAVVGNNMLLVTQQTNSTLVKVQLDPTTGRPLSCASFLLGDFWAGLHGLAASQVYPGHVWASLQFKSVLVRINVGLDQASAPTVEQEIPLPSSVSGPHCVCECGSDLWTSCKDSSHVVRINHTDPTDFTVYPCSRRPIFIAMHPTSGDVYASLDTSSKIWRLMASTGDTTEYDIPAAQGNPPVGLVAAPDGNVWFTLLGGSSGGTATFARISAEAEFQYFTLTTAIAANAGLIHLAFDWDYYLKEQTSSSLRLWLLSSSLVATAGNSLDAVFTVLIDSELSRITTQHSIVLPTQLCANHRILPHSTGLFVSQLSVSSLAHIAGAAALKPADVVGETTDMYSDFGLGQSSSYYLISEPQASRGALLGPAFRSVTTTTTTRALPPTNGRAGKRPRITADDAINL